MPNLKAGFWKSRNAKILFLVGLVILALAVRLTADSGPVYGIGDEGIYLAMFSNAIVFHGHPTSFATDSVYRTANFSIPLQYAFNENIIFRFYSGFVLPELAFLKVLGYTAGNAIIYVILNSLLELALVFLILDMVSGRRAAVIGGILLAFLPLDVVLSVRVLPIIPMVMVLTAAVYLFLRKERAKGRRERIAYSFIVGFLIGLAFLVHPEGVILLPFLLLYSLITALKKKNFVEEIGLMALIVFGSFVAFSIAGIPYLMATGRFLLYPQVDHNVFIYQFYTEAQTQFHLGSNLIFSYTNGGPLAYLYLLFKVTPTQNLFVTRFDLVYCSILGYAAFLMLPLFRSKKLRNGRFFVYMLAFYIVCLSILPIYSFVDPSGQLIVVMVNSDVMYSSILILPLIVISALELDHLMESKSEKVRYLALIIIVAFVFFSALQISYDMNYYRSSMYDTHQLIGFVKAHPDGVFYSEPLIAQNVGDITGYKYDVTALGNCNSTDIAALERVSDSYLVLGGTISVVVPENEEYGYDACVSTYMRNVTMVYNVSNPYDPLMPLQVFKPNSTN